MLKNKKGNVTLYVIFILITFALMIFTGMIAPMGAYTSTKVYAIGERMLNSTGQIAINEINNADVKASIVSAVTDAQYSTSLNVTIMSAFYQYSWIVVLLGSLILFILISRVLVEQNKSSGFV